MAKAEDYRVEAQQRLIEVFEALLDEPLYGVGATELAGRVESSQPQVFRTLKNLELAGWAEQTPMGTTWRVTRRATQAAERLRRTLADIHHQYLD